MRLRGWGGIWLWGLRVCGEDGEAANLKESSAQRSTTLAVRKRDYVGLEIRWFGKAVILKALSITTQQETTKVKWYRCINAAILAMHKTVCSNVRPNSSSSSICQQPLPDPPLPLLRRKGTILVLDGHHLIHAFIRGSDGHSVGM